MSSKHQVKRYTVRNLLLAGIAAGSLAAAPAAEASRPVMGRIVAGPSQGKPVMGRIVAGPSSKGPLMGRIATGPSSKGPLMGRIATGNSAKKVKHKKSGSKGGGVKITRGFIITP